MQKMIGVVSLVIGIMLLVWARDMAQSIGSQVQQAFTGAPTDRVTYFRIAGVALMIFGLFQIFWPARSK